MDIPRVTVKLKKRNPLFKKWITKLYDSAVQNESPDQERYKTALDSLEKYPLVLKNGLECAILQGFDKKLCSYLDTMIEQHNINKSKKDQYVPAFRSGGYAILCTLHQNKLVGISDMSKKELEYQGQKYCDSSFTKRKPGTTFAYTAWSSMKTLIAKGLVNKSGNKFSLTGSGIQIAEHLATFDNESQSAEYLLRKSPITIEEPVSKLPSSSGILRKSPVNIEEPILELNSTSFGNANCIIFNPGDFEVFLLIDKQETNFTSKEDDVTVSEMKKYPTVLFELRRLSVGDFLWIARHKVTREELVLPYAVERKRMDDLAGSITDGRYHEQKYRLKLSGVPNIIYLIEEYQHTRLPLSTLMQAAANTTVQDKIMTHHTANRVSSVKFLATMTAFIGSAYKSKPLAKCALDAESKFAYSDSNILQLPEFKCFNQQSNKNKCMNVKNMFIKQLIQLKGVSIEKALAITQHYNTPQLLLDKYRDDDDHEQQTKPEDLLAKIKCVNSHGSVGPHVSKMLYKYYTSEVLH